MSETKTLTGLALDASRLQYAAEEYRHAIDLLAANGTTVADRRAALVIRDDFERRMRSGELDIAKVAEYAATVAYASQSEECADPDNCNHPAGNGWMCLRCAARVCEAHLDWLAEERQQRKGPA